MTVKTHVTHVGPAFYRLNVSGFEYGSIIDERETLPEILALLEDNGVTLHTVTESTSSKLAFEGVTEDDLRVRVTLWFYRETAPPDGWPSPDDLLGTKR